MIKMSKAITLSKQSIDGMAVDHSYWPPENICRNYLIYKNLKDVII